MKHTNKIGKCILDKHIKFVKKLLKKNPISFSGRYFTDNDCVIKVVNIRKYVAYAIRASDNIRFCYEVDVVVKFNKNIFDHYYSASKSKNSRVRRYKNEKKLLEELEYFNMTDIQISKVTFEN